MKKIILLLVLAHLYACSSPKNGEDATYSKELKETKKITLPIDENTYFLSKSIFQFEEDGKEYLHFENSRKGMYEIITFDLEKQDVHKRLPIEQEGPNGIPAMYGSKPYPDSKNYLIFQNMAFRITQMDGNGKVLRNYQLKSPGRFVRVMLASFCYFPSFVSFPDFSRRFSVSLANSIDTFWEVLLKRFTLLMDKPDSGFLFGKNGCPRWSIHSYIYIPC